MLPTLFLRLHKVFLYLYDMRQALKHTVFSQSFLYQILSMSREKMSFLLTYALFFVIIITCNVYLRLRLEMI